MRSKHPAQNPESGRQNTVNLKAKKQQKRGRKLNIATRELPGKMLTREFRKT
tara:strand:- start:213 stop:368 length:156 start_codon:yes stop_codon:yes gene_type:complete